MYVHIIGVAVALFRCAQKRYEIPRNAFSNLDRFLRSDRQPSEPTTTAQQDQQQCSHTHMYTCICAHSRTLDLTTTKTQWAARAAYEVSWRVVMLAAAVVVVFTVVVAVFCCSGY